MWIKIPEWEKVLPKIRKEITKEKNDHLSFKMAYKLKDKMINVFAIYMTECWIILLHAKIVWISKKYVCSLILKNGMKRNTVQRNKCKTQ